MRILLMVMLLICFSSAVKSQSVDPDKWIVWILERFGEEFDEETLMDRLSLLEAYLATPMPVSNVDAAFLHTFQVLTDEEVDTILTWIETTRGEKLSDDMFRSTVELDDMVIEFVASVVSFDPIALERGRRRWQGFGRGAVQGMVDYKLGQVYPKQSGYAAEGQYLGPSFTVREQVVLQKNTLSARFSRYKMAGEPIDYPQKLGPWTGSIVYQAPKQETGERLSLQSVIVGDHRFRAGLGLQASTGSMRVDGTQLRASGLTSAPATPNGASPSGKFHRGAALQATAGNTTLAISYSSRRLSASITDTLLYTPGWSTHIRTTNDLEKHHNISLSSVSVMARRHGQIRSLNWVSGVSAVGFRWSDTLSRRAGLSYARDFAGSHGIELSTFGSVAYKNTSYTAEIGHANGKIAWIQSIQTRTPGLDLGAWARRYPFGFDTRFGNPASAYGGSNESGLGAWLRIKPVARVNALLWSDTYASMGPRFGTRLPVKGREWGVRVDWRLGTGRRVEGSYRSRVRLENATLPDTFNRMFDYRYWNEGISAKLGVHYQVSRALRYRVQVAYSEKVAAGERYQGWGTSALVTLSLKQVKLYAQTSTFSSDDHESRSYFYEYDMLGSFRIPSFSGYGRRSYVMGQIEVLNSMAIRIKVGVTEYLDRRVIGTGADASVGARRWNGDVQLRWTF